MFKEIWPHWGLLFLTGFELNPGFHRLSRSCFQNRINKVTTTYVFKGVNLRHQVGSTFCCFDQFGLNMFKPICEPITVLTDILCSSNVPEYEA